MDLRCHADRTSAIESGTTACGSYGPPRGLSSRLEGSMLLALPRSRSPALVVLDPR